MPNGTTQSTVSTENVVAIMSAVKKSAVTTAATPAPPPPAHPRHTANDLHCLKRDTAITASFYDAAAIDVLLARAALREQQRKRGEREPTPTPLCSSPAFLDKSIARLRADADGGDAAMDTTETAGTTYELLPPSATSYSIEQPQCRR